jgi:hypothetical protein
MSTKGDPNAVWVATDLDIDIAIQPGSVPKDLDSLYEFSQCMNEFLIKQGSAWANFILFDSDGNEQCSLRYDFTIIEK